MDGVEHAFDTAEERDAWADANGPSVQKLSRTVTDWDTTATDYFGAQTFSDEEAAKAFVASHSWKVQSFEYYRCRDCGEEFDDELDMAKHLQDTGHFGYNKLWSYTAYCGQASGKSRSFDDEDEANAYAASQTPTYHPVQRDVAYWRASDGLEFSYEADANYHLSQMGAPRRYEATHDVVSWKTSDGQTFDTEAAAQTHGQTLYLTVSKGSRDVVTWHCAGSDYATEAEANAAADAAADALRPQVATGTRQVACWRTSDGREFDTEAEAKAWADAQNAQVSRGKWRYNGRGWWYAYSGGGYLAGRYPAGRYPAGRWEQINGSWYLFDGAGYMLIDWQISGGSWYWLGSDGAMKTGWQNVGGAWYYLTGGGSMATGWLNLNGTWFFLNGSGAMATGWQRIGSAWYFMDASGAMAHDRWIGDYYVTSSGAMATSQWIGPWWVGADGRWVA